MKNRGFTLIEVMITVAIVAIIAVIAVPSFSNSMQKSRRADGMAALTSLQIAMEKYRGSCSTYADAIITGVDDCANDDIQGATSSNDSFYTISIVAASSTGNAYKIEADPTGVQVGDTDCDPMSITVNNANPRGLKEPAACW